MHLTHRSPPRCRLALGLVGLFLTLLSPWATAQAIWRVDSIALAAPQTGSLPVERAELALAFSTPKAPLNLPLVRLRASSPSPAASAAAPLLFIPGGPGLSGIQHLQLPEFRALLLELARDRDVILFDPRGTGAARPSLLPTAQPLLQPGTLASREAFAGRLTEVSNDVLRRAADVGWGAEDFSFDQAVEDIERIRLQLGVERMALLAHSFGAQVALEYAQRHARVERMTLISPRTVEQLPKSPAEADAFLRSVLSLAAQDAAIAAALPDLATSLATALHKLDAQPLAVSVQGSGGPESYRVGGYALRFMLSKFFINDPDNFIHLPRLIQDLQEGRRPGALVFNLGRLQRGGVALTWFSNDASVAVPKARREQVEGEAATSLLADAMNFPLDDVGGLWARAPRGYRTQAAALEQVATLVVAGSLDGVTPIQQAAMLAAQLPRGQLLRVVNGGHQSVLRDARVRDAVSGFQRGDPVPAEISMPAPRFAPLAAASP